MTTLAELQGPDMEPPEPRPLCCSCERSRHLHEDDVEALRQRLSMIAGALSALGRAIDSLERAGHPAAHVLARANDNLEAEEGVIRDVAYALLTDPAVCEELVICAACAYEG